DSEGEQIRPGVQLLGADLFGRHISYGAERRARTGEVGLHIHGCGVCVRTYIANCWSHFRQTEVENLRVSALNDENVCWLEIAVDDASSVSGVECIGDVNGKGKKDVHF